MSDINQPGSRPYSDMSGIVPLNLWDFLAVLVENKRGLLIFPVMVGLVVLGIAYTLTPTFTARAVFLPPQQQQSAAAGALQSLGALANLAGVSGAVKTPADQYVALMQSATISDRIISAFKLMPVYGTESKERARTILAGKIRINVGKKDGLVSVEVDDTDPDRAAAIANGYVSELKKFTDQLALTEFQQRRKFFEQQLDQTRKRLVDAQQAVQSSGINEGALRAEPRAAAEAYSSLRAQITTAEIRIQSASKFATAQSSEIKREQETLKALKQQLAKVEGANSSAASGDYIDKYREYKYQESLMELFAKQFEMAKLDESRDGALIQVIDEAAPPEFKSKPRKGFLAIGAAVIAEVIFIIFIFGREVVRSAAASSDSADKLKRVKKALDTL